MIPGVLGTVARSRGLQLLATAVGIALLSACGKADPEAGRKALHLPPANFVADVARGNQLFSDNCAVCHGAKALGSARGPSLIHKIYRSRHHADLAFQWAARDGVRAHHWKFGDMPPQPQMTPEAMGHIIAWVRREQRLAGIQ